MILKTQQKPKQEKGKVQTYGGKKEGHESQIAHLFKVM